MEVAAAFSRTGVPSVRTPSSGEASQYLLKGEYFMLSLPQVSLFESLLSFIIGVATTKFMPWRYFSFSFSTSKPDESSIFCSFPALFAVLGGRKSQPFCFKRFFKNTHGGTCIKFKRTVVLVGG